MIENHPYTIPTNWILIVYIQRAHLVRILCGGERGCVAPSVVHTFLPQDLERILDSRQCPQPPHPAEQERPTPQAALRHLNWEGQHWGLGKLHLRPPLSHKFFVFIFVVFRERFTDRLRYGLIGKLETENWVLNMSFGNEDLTHGVRKWDFTKILWGFVFVLELLRLRYGMHRLGGTYR